MGALRSMNWGLIKAMSLATQLCGPSNPASRFTFDFFLCGLYLWNRKRVLCYVAAEEPYKRMVRELCGGRVEVSARGRFFGLENRGETVSMAIRLDDDFVDILLRAKELSHSAGRQKIELRDIMSALAINEEVVRKLREEKGIMLMPPVV